MTTHATPECVCGCPPHKDHCPNCGHEPTTHDPLSPQWEDCKICGGDHWTKDHPDLRLPPEKRGPMPPDRSPADAVPGTCPTCGGPATIERPDLPNAGGYPTRGWHYTAHANAVPVDAERLREALWEIGNFSEDKDAESIRRVARAALASAPSEP
jgi:hypothetical protein